MVWKYIFPVSSLSFHPFHGLFCRANNFNFDVVKFISFSLLQIFFFNIKSKAHSGEGNGKPLQCSCLENPRDGRAWWAAVYGVAQSRTRLKRLSSSKAHSGGSDSKKIQSVMQEAWVLSLGQEDLLEKEMTTHSSILARKSHGQRNLAGYSPWGCTESDMTEQLNIFTF